MTTKAITTQIKKKLVLEGDPEQQLDFAMKAANTLMKAVSQKPKKVIIRGEQYLEYGDWQTLARFFGATAAIEWSKPLLDATDKNIGYEARAIVKRNGVEVSSAEAMCMRAEKNWKDRDEFMLRSMAQTRASAKALRNAYGWVAELAGMKSTPAEEMGEMYDQTPIKDFDVPTVYYNNPEDDGPNAPGNKITPPKIVADARKTDLQKKAQIKELVDSIVINPLAQTPAAYGDYIWQQTGFLLEPKNYDVITVELQKIKAGEK